MFRNYLLVAWRNILRNKTLALINISGLSIGLASCMLIFLYTKDELSFDRFHKKKDQLYLLTCTILESGKESKFGLSFIPHGPAFKKDIPEIETYIRVNPADLLVKI